MRATDLDRLEAESFVYVTTTGRVTGRPHTIEIWFARRGSTLYLLAGGGDRSDWVRNLRRHSDVRVRLGSLDTEAQARVVTADDEDALARRIVTDKYQSSYGGDLSGWRESALPIAIDLDLDG
jgi:deazaflavin-dependent oxidoreductase (nitroreductase family)